MAQPAPLTTGETLAAVYDRLAALAPAHGRPPPDAETRDADKKRPTDEPAPENPPKRHKTEENSSSGGSDDASRGGASSGDDTSGGASRMASAFLGTMLCFGTYGTAMALRSVKRAGKMFNRSVRNAMGDYGVTIAILAFTGVAIAFKR